jgi:hypothetical protein
MADRHEDYVEGYVAGLRTAADPWVRIRLDQPPQRATRRLVLCCHGATSSLTLASQQSTRFRRLLPHNFCSTA